MQSNIVDRFDLFSSSQRRNEKSLVAKNNCQPEERWKMSMPSRKSFIINDDKWTALSFRTSPLLSLNTRIKVESSPRTLSLWCLQISTVLNSSENNKKLTILKPLEIHKGNSPLVTSSSSHISCNTDRASHQYPSSIPPERMKNRAVKETFANPKQYFNSVYLLWWLSFRFLLFQSRVYLLVLGIRVQTILRNYVTLSTRQLQIALIEQYTTTEDVNETNASPLLIIYIGCRTTRSWWKLNWMTLQWCTRMYNDDICVFFFAFLFFLSSS